MSICILVLRALGLPSCLLNLISNLYDCHKCNIVLGGCGLHAGFSINAGIRQGCPLSPILFALVVDLLLRRLQRVCPEVIIRAFADDIAVVAPDMFARLSCLTQLFTEMAKVSGLHLNIPKCVLIPLWPVDGELLSRDIARVFPHWASMKIADKGTYLGFVIGPGAKHESWNKPLSKYLASAQVWGAKGVGMQYATFAYSIYTLPILSYIGQLCSPPQEALDVEWKALKALLPGPGNWCNREDLHHMAANFGQARSLPSLSHTCMAAQKRVFIWEDRMQGGLNINTKYDHLQTAIRDTNHLDRFVVWNDWYLTGPVATLHGNSAKLDHMGLTSQKIMQLVGWESIVPDAWAKGVRKVRKHTQKVICKAIRTNDLPDAIGRVRHKLARWNLSGLPRVTAMRTTRMLKNLGRLVPPRVSAAVWKSMWNGWTTHRRFGRPGHKC